MCFFFGQLPCRPAACNMNPCTCLQLQWKVAPALAAGCTVVLKPSEMASLTCLEMAAIADEVQLPPGVLNVVTGLGVEAGAPLRCNFCTSTWSYILNTLRYI